MILSNILLVKRVDGYFYIGDFKIKADRVSSSGFGVLLVFEPLRDFATHLCLTNISLEGKGREESIRFAGALAESKLLQKMGLIKEKTVE